MNFKELQKKAEQHWLRGNLTHAYSLYSDLLKIAKTDEEIQICRESLTIIHSEMIHSDKKEAKLTKILKEIVKAQFLILTMFFLTSFGKYDNTCFELIYSTDSVKVYQISGLSKDYQNLIDFNKKKIDFIKAYQEWEPYLNKTVKIETKKLYNID